MTSDSSLQKKRAPEILRQHISVSWDFPVVFTRNAFSPENESLAKAFDFDANSKVMVCLDSGVAGAWPDLAGAAREKLLQLGCLDIRQEPLVLPGGEAAKKDLSIVTMVAEAAAEFGLDRQSYILAIGGGAFLDAVGLGASLVHRGVRLVRMPTTVLAQNDAGIGVKNGVNACGQKNFLGSFAPPHAVVNDYDFLKTLDERQWRSGIAEAVKVACIKSRKFFSRIEKMASRLGQRDGQAMEELVYDCARLHLDHTGGSGDPFESGDARPLDFGHWSAHWLEMASNNELLHGEAVAIGVALDALYAAAKGHITETNSLRIVECLKAAGFAIWHDLLEKQDKDGSPAVFEGLDMFREHLGGKLTLTLPAPLGSIIDINNIDRELFKSCLGKLKELSG